MKTKKLSWLFGFTDRDCKEMIEEQARTESTVTEQSKGKVKVMTKGYKKNFNKRPRDNKR